MDFNYPDNIKFDCIYCGICCGDTSNKKRHIMASPKKQIMVGIDASNTRVITVVMSQDTETGDLNIVGFSNIANTGMRKGMVVDIDETINSISSSLEEAERMSGVPIEKALIS